MPETPPSSTYLQNLPSQLTRMAIYLAIIAGLHFSGYLVLVPTLRYTLIGIIVLSAFVPRRFSALASGVGFLIIAALGYFHFGSTLVGVLCGVLGVWSLIDAFRDLRR